MKYAPAIVLICLALLLGSASAQPEAADLGLPIVRNGAAQISSAPVLLDAGDNSYIDSVTSSNGLCTFVAFIDRDNGNRLLVKQDIGDRLIDVPLPPTAGRSLRSLARDFPGFTAPGDKQADGSLSVRNGVLSLHYTSRAEGEPSGAFHVPPHVCDPDPALHRRRGAHRAALDARGHHRAVGDGSLPLSASCSPAM